MDNNSSISSSVQLQQRQWVNPDQVMMRRAKKKRGCRPLVDQDQNSCLTEDRREQEVSSGTSLVFRKPKKHEGSSPLRKVRCKLFSPPSSSLLFPPPLPFPPTMYLHSHISHCFFFSIPFCCNTALNGSCSKHINNALLW